MTNILNRYHHFFIVLSVLLSLFTLGFVFFVVNQMSKPEAVVVLPAPEPSPTQVVASASAEVIPSPVVKKPVAKPASASAIQ